MDRQGGAYIGDIGVIQGCTHHMHLELPRLVTRCVMYFLKHNLDSKGVQSTLLEENSPLRSTAAGEQNEDERPAEEAEERQTVAAQELQEQAAADKTPSASASNVLTAAGVEEASQSLATSPGGMINLLSADNTSPTIEVLNTEEQWDEVLRRTPENVRMKSTSKSISSLSSEALAERDKTVDQLAKLLTNGDQAAADNMDCKYVWVWKIATCHAKSESCKNLCCMSAKSWPLSNKLGGCFSCRIGMTETSQSLSC